MLKIFTNGFIFTIKKRYAALADVNNLCSSIFDELNKSAKSLNKNVPSVTTTQPQPQPLPSNGSFGNQGNCKNFHYIKV